jgi:signal transduction histidine kinase
VVEINRSEHHPDTVPMSDLWGLPASKVGPWFSPADRETFIRQLAAQGHLHAYEATLEQPNGSTIEAKVWAEQIEIDEEPCVLSCIVDTSEEKRKEALLRDIASSMNGDTAQAFFSTLVKHMSHALGADMVLIGELSPPHEIQTIAAFKNGQPTPNFSFSIARRLCEKSMHQREPLVLGRNPNDSESWQHLDDAANYQSGVCQALHDNEGNPIGLINALWTHPRPPEGDVVALMAIFASRAKAEMMRLQGARKIEQLNETLELRVQARTAELSKLNKELDSFAYSISHDLKSPLRAIDGFTQLLSERLAGRLDAEEQQLMSRVLGSTHRMATLMADLLALARVSQVPMERERLHLSAMAEEVFSNLPPEPGRAQIHCQIEPGVYGYGDRVLTQTLLEQLIGNAQKYTRDQPRPLIEFGQRRNATGQEASALVFFVRDNGAGFSMAHADKLFKPFQRLHMPSAGFEGTGIGLATARRIVERHGGTIEGDGKVNQGAEFSFSLEAPLSKAPHARPPSRTETSKTWT